MPESAAVAILRALNDVERLAQIEESALPTEKQDVLRHCLLQIAVGGGEWVTSPPALS